MNTDLSKQLLNDICSAYGSIATPNWSFKEKRYRKRPYDVLAERLAKTGTTEETTDLNDDLSVVISVCFDGGDGVSVRLSLVGNYACVNNGSGVFLSHVDLMNADQTSKVLNCLVEEGIELLNPADLTQRIDFGGNLVSLYEVLFSRDEAIE